ncbi:MAG: phosphotransferase [Candidatus Levybacteria bacterium]|nr:phosphotransferase [Candidatus Levybacteria bacterium]
MKNELSPKSLSSQSIVSFVETKYGIVASNQSLQFKGGVESAAWKLITDKKNYVVKVYSQREGNPERVEDEVNLYDFLLKHSINVPVVSLSQNGKRVEILKTDNATFSVMMMQFEELRLTHSSSVTQNEIEKIASTMARMHQALENYPRKENLYKSNLMSPNKLQEWGSYEQLIKSLNKKEFSSEELAHIRESDSKIIDYLKRNFPPQAVNYSILHNDIALEHAQFLPDGEVYFFDFADRSYDPISFELAVFLTHLFRSDNISYTRWEELQTWVINGYQSVRKLPQVDLDAIKPFILRRIEGELWYLNQLSIELNRFVDNRGNRRRYQFLDCLLRRSGIMLEG